MTTFNRRQTLATMGAAAAVGLAAPAVAQGKKITLGALRFTSHSGTFVAYQREYFKQAGLDVELKFFQAAQPMAVAIASGDVDYAVTAISGGLAAPMSRPTGPLMRAMSAAVKPASSSRATREAWVRFDPSAPI